jgi:biotin operon repressor
MAEQKRDFTGVWIPAHVLLHPDLSILDKYIYAEISCFDECFLANKTLAKRAGCSEDSITRSVKKLKDFGFIVQTRFDGRTRYLRTLKDIPMPEPTQIAEADTAKTGKQIPPVAVLDNNRDNKENTTTSEPSSQEIPEIIKAFESINPACSRYYGNKTQREAVRQLIEIHTYERVLKIVTTVLPKSNGLAYVPTITTPLQLLEKYSALETALKRAQSNYKKEHPQFTIVNGVPIKI